MKLLTRSILKRLPGLYETSGLPKAEVRVPLKLFNAFGSQRWYITEFDPVNSEAFCFCNLGDDELAELGYVSLSELIAVSHPFFKLERDLSWNQKTTLKQVMNFEVR